MKPAVEMSNPKRAMVFSVLGIVCWSACAVLTAVPLLRAVELAAIAHTAGGVLAMTLVSVSFVVTGIARERSMPVWLRALGIAAVIPAGPVFLVVANVLGAWLLLIIALLPLFTLVAWLAAGRPKLPTGKEFNRG